MIAVPFGDAFFATNFWSWGCFFHQNGTPDVQTPTLQDYDLNYDHLDHDELIKSHEIPNKIPQNSPFYQHSKSGMNHALASPLRTKADAGDGEIARHGLERLIATGKPGDMQQLQLMVYKPPKKTEKKRDTFIIPFIFHSIPWFLCSIFPSYYPIHHIPHFPMDIPNFSAFPTFPSRPTPRPRTLTSSSSWWITRCGCFGRRLRLGRGRTGNETKRTTGEPSTRGREICTGWGPQDS